jgi:hypothetical protein
MGPVFGALAILTIPSGGAMIAVLRETDVSAGWWTATVTGIATTVLTLPSPFGPEMSALRAVDRLRASIGESPAPDGEAALSRLAQRFRYAVPISPSSGLAEAPL